MIWAGIWCSSSSLWIWGSGKMKWHFPHNFLGRSNREVNTIKDVLSFFLCHTHTQTGVNRNSHYLLFIRKQIIDPYKTVRLMLSLRGHSQATMRIDRVRCQFREGGTTLFGKQKCKSKTEWFPTCPSGCMPQIQRGSQIVKRQSSKTCFVLAGGHFVFIIWLFLGHFKGTFLF